jgi:hypothetical protein
MALLRPEPLEVLEYQLQWSGHLCGYDLPLAWLLYQWGGRGSQPPRSAAACQGNIRKVSVCLYIFCSRGLIFL